MSGKAIPETLAALGVIASMVFVGLEIRQNNLLAQTRQRIVELQGDGYRAADLGNLERMRQARPIQVALVIYEHLGLVNKPPERGGMDDAIAVALVLAAVNGVRLAVAPASRS